MKLIDKDALVAEIEKLHIQHISPNYVDEAGLVLEQLEDNICSLEVKEVDLDEETLHSELSKIYASVYDSKDIKATKHFFELGLNASNPLTWEDMRELHIILISLDVDIELSRSKLQKETLGYYEEVLKQFKAKKGGQ